MKTILRKSISIIILSIVALSFSACVNNELPEQTIKQKNISVEKWTRNDNPNEYKIVVINAAYDNTPINVILALKEAAYFGKTKGFQYFSVNSLSSGKNEFRNKEMIPITSIEEYLIFRGNNGIIGYSSNFGVEMKLSFLLVSYTNEKDDNSFYWNVEKVISEEITLYNSYSKEKNETNFEKENEKIKEIFNGTPIKYKILERTIQ